MTLFFIIYKIKQQQIVVPCFPENINFARRRASQL